MKSSKSKRIIGQSRAGNRRSVTAPADWPDSDSPIESPDRDQECAGCASLQVEVSALRIEVETLTGTIREHHLMIADLNARLGER